MSEAACRKVGILPSPDTARRIPDHGATPVSDVACTMRTIKPGTPTSCPYLIRLHRRQLRIFQRQPFAARAFEIDLHARIRTAAFHTGNNPLAELLVEHALADAP